MNTDCTSIGAALGAIPSGCAILTLEHQGRSTGVLVSWIQQASFEPLCISVCIKTGRPVEVLLGAAQRFVLNIIAEKNKAAMFRHFGRGFGPNEDAFSGIEMHPTEFGPVLTDCVAHLGCRVACKVNVGDHDLYVAEVIAGERFNNLSPYIHVRKSGLSY